MCCYIGSQPQNLQIYFKFKPINKIKFGQDKITLDGIKSGQDKIRLDGIKSGRNFKSKLKRGLQIKIHPQSIKLELPL